LPVKPRNAVKKVPLMFSAVLCDAVEFTVCAVSQSKVACPRGVLKPKIVAARKIGAKTDVGPVAQQRTAPENICSLAPCCTRSHRCPFPVFQVYPLSFPGSLGEHYALLSGIAVS